MTVPRERLARCGAVLLGLAPAVVLPGGIDRHTLPKAALGALGAALVLLAPATRLPRRISLVIGAAAVILVAAALLGAAPLPQLLGRAPRYEGVVVGAAYLCSFLAGTRLFAPTRPELFDAFATAFAVATVAVGGLALIEAAGLRPFGGAAGQRTGSLIGNATEQGAFGVLALGLFALLSLRRRPLAMAAAVAATVCVVTSGSRAAVLGGLVTATILALVSVGRDRRVVLGGTFVMLTAAFLLPSTRDRLTGASPLSSATVTGRLDTWREAWALVAERPLGVGPSGYADAIPSSHTAQWFLTQPADLVLDSPHTLPLQLWAAGGPVLVVVALLGAWMLARPAVRRLRALRLSPHGELSAAALIGLPGYMVVLLTHFTGPTTTVAAATLLGAALPSAVAVRSAAPARPPLRSWAYAAASALVAALLIVGAVAEFPLRAGIDAVAARDAEAADTSFVLATRLRPWTVDDIDLIALHAYAASGRNGDTVLGAHGVTWVGRVGLLTSSPRALGDAGSVLESSGDLAAADRYFTRALELAPRDPVLTLRQGVVAAQRGDLARAERLFVDVTRTVPSSPDPWRNLTILYGLTGDGARQAGAQAMVDRLSALP